MFLFQILGSLVVSGMSVGPLSWPEFFPRIFAFYFLRNKSVHVSCVLINQVNNSDHVAFSK
jgi:hypothetical protein